VPRTLWKLTVQFSIAGGKESKVSFSRRTLWIGTALVLAVAAVLLVAVYGGGGGGGVGY
jgi:hypothetical protein